MHIETILTASMTLILLLGGSITYFGFKAYRRTGDPALRALVIGFGFVTVGAILGGVAHQLFGLRLEVGMLVNALLMAIGFAILLYSLFIE